MGTEKEVERVQGAAYVRLASRATVGLNPAETVQDEADLSFASGVLVSRGKRVFVATAAHYLDEVPPAEMTIMFCSELAGSGKNLAEVKEGIESGDAGVFLADKLAVLSHRLGSVVEDVALIEISPSSVRPGCWSYPLGSRDCEDAMPQESESVWIAGLPSMSHIRLGKKQLARVLQVRQCPTVQVTNPENWSTFDPECHFAIKYEVAKLPDRLPPQGLSGSGVWRMSFKRTESGLEIPSPVLIGIQIAHNDVRGCLKVTSVRRLLNLLPST